MPGPPRRPTAIAERLGRPSHRRKNRTEPKANPLADFQPPRDLKGRTARAEWRRVAPILTAMGVMSEADRGPLMAYCKAYEWMVEADSLDAFRKAFAVMIRCSKEFGMTASARSGMEVGKPLTPAKRHGLKEILDGAPNAAVH